MKQKLLKLLLRKLLGPSREGTKVDLTLKPKQPRVMHTVIPPGFDASSKLAMGSKLLTTSLT